MRIKAALLILGLALAGCSADTADQEAAAGTEDSAGIAQPMTDAMDDAKAVEDQVMEAKEEVDAAVDEAEDSADETAADE